MAMKIIIGRFDEQGEPVWFEVETNDWKDEEGQWRPMIKEIDEVYLKQMA